MSYRLATLVFAGAVALTLPSFAAGATIVGNAVVAPSLPADLSDLGTLDWAYWHINSSTLLASRPPTNEKLGGSSIGNPLSINGTGLRGSTTNVSLISFAFDDGTSTANGSVTVRGVFTNPGTTAGRGVQISLTLPEVQEYTVLMWVSGYRSTGALTAALPGASDYTDSTFTFADDKPARLYQMSVTPDQVNDLLTLSYVTSTAPDTSSHVLLGGLAISAVPEPAGVGLLLPAAVLALRRRKAGPQ